MELFENSIGMGPYCAICCQMNPPFLVSEVKRQSNLILWGDGRQGIHSKVKLAGDKEVAQLCGDGKHGR